MNDGVNRLAVHYSGWERQGKEAEQPERRKRKRESYHA